MWVTWVGQTYLTKSPQKYPPSSKKRCYMEDQGAPNKGSNELMRVDIRKYFRKNAPANKQEGEEEKEMNDELTLMPSIGNTSKLRDKKALINPVQKNAISRGGFAKYIV